MTLKSLTTPIYLWYHNHVYRPLHYRRMRQLVIKRRAELQRQVKLVIKFNETTATSVLILKICSVIVATADGLSDNAVKNLTQQAQYLRTLNRHTINYSKL